MSAPLKLTCRCGWASEFSEDQLGIAITCPSCNRDFFITDDPVTFTNRNIGDADLSFDLGDEETTPVEAPKKGSQPQRARTSRASSSTRKRQGKKDTSSKGAVVQRQGTAGGGGASTLPTFARQSGFQGTTRSERAKRRSLKKERKSPILMGIILFLIVGGISFGVYRNMDSSDRTNEACRFADAMMSGATGGAVSAQRKHFGEEEVFLAFADQMDRLLKDPKLKFRIQERGELKGDRFWTHYRLDSDREEYECKIGMSWKPQRERWIIESCRLKPVPQILRGQ